MGDAIRSPSVVPRDVSRALKKWVDVAQREFLRMTDVTERISERRTCLWGTALGGNEVNGAVDIVVDVESTVHLSAADRHVGTRPGRAPRVVGALLEFPRSTSKLQVIESWMVHSWPRIWIL